MATVKMSCAKSVVIPSSMLKHPERKPGEVFIQNIGSVPAMFTIFSMFSTLAVGPGEEITGESVFLIAFNLDQIPYKSKRLGQIAYDKYGNEVSSLRPVFVSKQEYKEKMANQKV